MGVYGGVWGDYIGGIYGGERTFAWSRSTAPPMPVAYMNPTTLCAVAFPDRSANSL